MRKAKDVVAFLESRLGAWDCREPTLHSMEYRWNLTFTRVLLVRTYSSTPGGEVGDVELGVSIIGPAVNHTISAYHSTGFPDLLAELEGHADLKGGEMLPLMGALREFCTAVDPEEWISDALGAVSSTDVDHHNTGMLRWKMPYGDEVWLRRSRPDAEDDKWEYEFGIRWGVENSTVVMTASICGANVNELAEFFDGVYFDGGQLGWPEWLPEVARKLLGETE